MKEINHVDKLSRLETMGHDFSAMASEFNWSKQMDLYDAIDSSSLVLKGIVAGIKGYHMTLPSLVDDIFLEGLRSDKPILSQPVRQRFWQELGRRQGLLFDKVSAELTRSDGIVWVSTSKEHIENTESYGFPEIAFFCLKSLWNAATTQQAFPENKDTELMSMVDSELNRLLQGDGTQRSLVTLKPANPLILERTFTVESIKKFDCLVLQDCEKLRLSDTDEMYRKVNMGIPGPLEPNTIESVEPRTLFDGDFSESIKDSFRGYF